MCVIAVAVKTRISLETLRECEATNRHGGGCAWREAGQVRWQKGITAVEMHDLLATKPLPHICHFRIATVGAVGVELCHPFAVLTHNNSATHGVTNGSVLFHNGTCQSWRFYALLSGVTPALSDSQTVARMAAFRGEAVLENIAAEGGGVFATMHATKGLRLHGRFHQHGDHQFSNLRWVRQEAPPTCWHGVPENLRLWP